MPEGDTVYLAATRLDRALRGEILTRTDFRVPKYATLDLSHRAVLGVVSRGKHLLTRVAGGTTIHTHFRMDGAWHLYRPGERWEGPAWQVRLLLETAKWQAVGFRLPVIDVLPTPEEASVVGHLGPDPLGDDWDAGEALCRLRADGARTISDGLLDQRVIAGLGNVYRCELCFLRGLDPWTPVGEIVEAKALVALAGRVLQANRGRGGHVTTGDDRPGQRHWVYGRRGRPCRRCATPIRYRTAPPGDDEERVTYWCPRCQQRNGR